MSKPQCAGKFFNLSRTFFENFLHVNRQCPIIEITLPKNGDVITKTIKGKKTGRGSGERFVTSGGILLRPPFFVGTSNGV